METAAATKSTSLTERVNKLNKMILDGRILEAFDQYYAPEITMQENEFPATVGKEACRINELAFVNGITAFRGAAVKNVLVSDDISVVEWEFDFSHKEWGDRKYRQVSVQRWNKAGLIINEKFYYNN